jgi:nucleoid-associated protein YgaU
MSVFTSANSPHTQAARLMSRGWQMRCCRSPHRRNQMGLRDKYNYAVQTAKDLRMQGSAEEREGKLYFKGTTQTQEEANKIWDAIKTIPDWKNEVVADIKATGGGASAAGGTQTYTVKAGDTLSKIAKEHLGDANAYIDIFNANKDQLKDPDKIKPGQVLKMPAATKH